MRYEWKSEFVPNCVLSGPHVNQERGGNVIQFQTLQGITHFVLVFADISGKDRAEIKGNLEAFLEKNGLAADEEDTGLNCRVRVVSYAEFVLNRGLLIGSTPAVYTVLGCNFQTAADCLTVSLPENLRANVVAISQNVDVIISRHFVINRSFLGLISKKEPTPYWTVRITGVTQGYREGDIAYKISTQSRGQVLSADVPVSEEMLGIQFYVKTGSAVPDFVCPNNKYILNIRRNKGESNVV